MFLSLLSPFGFDFLLIIDRLVSIWGFCGANMAGVGTFWWFSVLDFGHLCLMLCFVLL